MCHEALPGAIKFNCDYEGLILHGPSENRSMDSYLSQGATNRGERLYDSSNPVISMLTCHKRAARSRSYELSDDFLGLLLAK